MDEEVAINAGVTRKIRRNKTSIEIGLAVLVILILVGSYFYSADWKVSTPEIKKEEASSETAEKSLGGELYKKAANPVADNLPEVVDAVPNPVENVYKNPFK